MRLHSIFQEKKLLWSALLDRAPSACLERLPLERLQDQLKSVQTKDAETNNLEQKNIHITSLHRGDKESLDIGDQTKKKAKQPFSNFFAVVSNGFLLNHQAKQLGEKRFMDQATNSTLGSPSKERLSKLLAAKGSTSLARLAFAKAKDKARAPKVSNLTAQIIFVFSSFEKDDLNKAFYLFQQYLTSLTNRLTALNSFEITGLHLTGSRIEAGTGKKRSAFATTGLRMQKVTGTLKAVRDLNQSLKLTEVPLSTQLYTVIRSPHVFKKTREQFAMTKLKRIVTLNVQSKATLRLLVDTAVLLKLPAEVKVIIRDI